MTRFRKVPWKLGLGVLAVMGMDLPAMACATCFGASDSALAKGMNYGIFSLLIVVVGVLSGVASFFIYLARRSASMPPESMEPKGSAEA